MDEPVKRVAVVRGASNAEIQDIFQGLVEQWRSQSVCPSVSPSAHVGRQQCADVLRRT